MRVPLLHQIKRWTLMPIKRLRQEKAPLLGHLSSFRQISQAVSVAFLFAADVIENKADIKCCSYPTIHRKYLY